MKKVIYRKNEKHLANKGRKILESKTITALCGLIIIGCLTTIKAEKLPNKNHDKSPVKPEISNTAPPETATVYPTEEIITSQNVENSNDITAIAQPFYEHLNTQKNRWGLDFTSKLNSIEDVENLILFIEKFNQFNKSENNNTNITSLSEYQEIISNYYSSCAKYNVKPQLNLILVNDPYAQKLVEKSEILAQDLINGQGQDFSIANKYYEFFGEQLCGNKIKFDIKQNAPIIVLLDEQYKQYRNQGNMKQARIKELPKDLNIDIYDQFSCPDTIDNLLLGEIDYSNNNRNIFDNVYNIIEEECSKYTLERKQ